MLTLGVLLLWRWRRGRAPGLGNPTFVTLAVFLAYMLVAHFLMFWWNWKWVGLYFVSFAPVVPVLLGVGFSALLAEAPPRSRRRRLLVAALVGFFVLPLYFVRNPLLPIGEVKAGDPFATAHTVAARLQQVVPRDAKVFYYGLNTAYYLSGLPQTYLQQLYNPDAAARPEVDERVLRRFGFVSPGQLRHWLDIEADFAVIDLRSFDMRSVDASLKGAEGLIAERLVRHFDLVETIDRPPFHVYAVHRRKRAEPDPHGARPTAPARDTTGTGPPR